MAEQAPQAFDRTALIAKFEELYPKQPEDSALADDSITAIRRQRDAYMQSARVESANMGRASTVPQELFPLADAVVEIAFYERVLRERSQAMDASASTVKLSAPDVSAAATALLNTAKDAIIDTPVMDATGRRMLLQRTLEAVDRSFTKAGMPVVQR